MKKMNCNPKVILAFMVIIALFAITIGAESIYELIKGYSNKDEIDPMFQSLSISNDLKSLYKEENYTITLNFMNSKVAVLEETPIEILDNHIERLSAVSLLENVPNIMTEVTRSDIDVAESNIFSLSVSTDSIFDCPNEPQVVAENGVLTIVNADGSKTIINFNILGEELEPLLMPKASEVNVIEFAEEEGEEETFTMPTADDYTGDDEEMRKKIAKTDKWNDLIYKVATEEGVDPVYVKCIVAQESVGNEKAFRKNGNGSCDYGLMQVNSSWGDIYDYDKMLKDPEYALRCGIDVIKTKKTYAESFDKEGTIFNISWFYNGYTKSGKEYAKLISNVYEGLTGNDATVTYFTENDF